MSGWVRSGLPRQVAMLMAIALLAQPLHAQTDTLGYGGLTGCTGLVIEQHFRTPWPAPPYDQWRVEYEALLAHERTHVEQMARYDSCAAVKAAMLTSPVDTVLAWEAESGCAQAKVYIAHGQDPRVLVGVFVARLRDKIQGQRELPAILYVLKAKCPELDGE